MKYIYEDVLLFIVAAHAVGITMTEDMIEAMMIETTTADHTGKLTIVRDSKWPKKWKAGILPSESLAT